jgi:F-type H+-transporting ATPase subunit b
MPQFDFAFFLPQMAWLSAFFAILYFLVVRTTLPKLGKVMQAREDKVLGDLNEAQAAKAQADSAAETCQASLLKVQDEARALIASARAAAQKEVEGKLHAVDADIAAQLDAAQADLDAARAKASAEIAGIAADAAGSIVERLTGARPSDDQASAAARAALGQA